MGPALRPARTLDAARLPGALRAGLACLLMAAVVAACTHGTPIGATPRTPVPSPSSPADVGRLLVEALGDTRYVSAEEYIAEASRATLPQATLKAEWEALAVQDGKYNSVGDVTAAPAASGTGTDVAVPVTFAGGNEVVHVTVDQTLHATAVDIPKGSGHNPVVAPSSPKAS
jgi:hypothetical protein